MNDTDFIWLSDIDSAESKSIGILAKNLFKIKKHEIEVQNFFCISSRKFTEFISIHSSDITSLINSINLEDIESISYASKQIQVIIDKYEFEDDFKTRLLENYRHLEEYDTKYSALSDKARELIKSGRELPTVTARLSLNKHICSYEAKINLKGIFQLISSIKSLWSEIFSMKSLYVIKTSNISIDEIFPAVVIQKTLLPSKSGDIYTVNPLNSNNFQYYIQAHWGLNNDFLDTVSSYIIDKTNNSFVSSKINSQEKYITKKSLFSEIIVQSIPENYQKNSPLSESELKFLAEVSGKIESIFDFPQHINWIVFNKKLIIVKTEPITNIFKTPVQISNTSTSDYLFKGTPINNNSSSGVYYKNFVFDKNAIFYVNEARASFIPYLMLSSGIISKSNSISSYLSVSCQELGVPCVINSPDVSSLQEGQRIKIEGPYVMLDKEAYSFAQRNASDSNEFSVNPSQDTENEFVESSDSVYEQPSSQESEYDFSLPDSQTSSQPASFNPNYESSFSTPESESDSDSEEVSFSEEETVEVSVSDIKDVVIELEEMVNSLVLKNAEKRRTQVLSEMDEREAKILSESEWIIRDLKKRLSALPDSS